MTGHMVAALRTWRAELLRAATRSTVGLAALCLALTAFAMRAAGPQHRPALWGFRNAAIFVATLLMGRAAVVAAGDFSSGTVRPWLISSPGRTAVSVGKLCATLTVTVGVALLISVAAWPVGAALASAPGPGQMATAGAQLTLAAAGLALFGHSLGLLTRSIPVSLTLALGWILPGEAVLGGSGSDAERWLPGTVLHAITLGDLPAGSSGPSAVAHALLPFLLLEVVAVAAFAMRDVSS